MKYFFTLFLLSFLSCFSISLLAQPCTTTTAEGCLCPDGTNECDLLPDIKISEQLLLDASQNPEVYGQLRVSVSTPNIGYGPLSVTSTDYFVCGTDTFQVEGANFETCPDGSAPKQLIKQKIYRKVGTSMQSYERWAGSMTYHPTHGHMHVDDWGVFSLRQEIAGIDDPLQWPIVAEGAKIGFCLMDFGSCPFYDGHCLDDNGEIMNDPEQIPNYGLGGGTYSCGLFDQGISAGYTDIYHYNLDGMDIPIPASLCNGTYQLVVEIDPQNHFLEMNEDNNIMVVPFTLTKQDISPEQKIRVLGNTNICSGESVTLMAELGYDFQWNTGETTPSITVTEAGTYTLSAMSCENPVSYNNVTINVFDTPEVSIVASEETICVPTNITLDASIEGEIAENAVFQWYDDANSNTPIATGTQFVTEELTETKTYYADYVQTFEGTYFGGPFDNTFGSGGLYAQIYNAHLNFDVHQESTLVSVKAFAIGDGERTIELRDSEGNVLQSITAFLPDGGSRVTLNFDLAVGENYQLGTSEWPSMFRNNSNVTYPYEVSNIVSITGSNYDDPDNNAYRYYHFYDWEVKEAGFVCSSREEITVEYTFCDGIENDAFTQNINVYPNPNKGVFELQFELKQAQDVNVKLMDIAGKTIFEETLQTNDNKFSKTYEFKDVAAGIYMLSVGAGNDVRYEKVIIE